MGAYITRRLLINLLVFLLITVVIFWLVHKAPGDPVAMMVPPDQLNSGSSAFIAAKRHELGLDQPLAVQYWHWLTGALHPQSGASVVGHMQVASVPGRNEPDGGDIDYPEVFDLIDQLGYTGWVGCEYRPRDATPGGTSAGLGWLKPYLKPAAKPAPRAAARRPPSPSKKG